MLRRARRAMAKMPLPPMPPARQPMPWIAYCFGLGGAALAAAAWFFGWRHR